MHTTPCSPSFQVHPAKLTHALRDAARARGVHMLTGTCVGLQLAPTDNASVQGVVVDGHGIVHADAVVLAMGPWTAHAARWLQEALPGTPHPCPQLGLIEGLKAHSVVMQADDGITPHAMFLQYKDSKGRVHEPEIYPRPAGEVYVCGVMEQPTAAPDDPRNVTPTDGTDRCWHRHAFITRPRCMCFVAAGSVGAVEQPGSCDGGG